MNENRDEFTPKVIPEVDVRIGWEISNGLYKSEMWAPSNRRFKITKDNLNYLYKFWDDFFEYYNNEKKTANELSENKMRVRVFYFLKEQRAAHESFTPDILHKIQLKVEEMSLDFHEKNIYECGGDLRKLFFNKDEQSARAYLLDKLKGNKDLGIVRSMGDFSLETIAIWVLSSLFNVSSLEEKSVRLAHLIEQLDLFVRVYHAHYNKDPKKLVDLSKRPVLPEEESKGDIKEEESKGEKMDVESYDIKNGDQHL